MAQAKNQSTNFRVVGDKRAYDHQETDQFLTTDEEFQQDLFRQAWIYATPPRDGQDLYRANLPFIRTNRSCESFNGVGLMGAKGLRANTRAIFNFAPFIVSKDQELIINKAEVSGITLKLPGGDVIDEALTELLQKSIKPQWKRLLKKVTMNGLVTGNAFLWPKKQQDGRVMMEVLFSNDTFANPKLGQIDDLETVKVKYKIENEFHEFTEFEQIITDQMAIFKQTGEPDQEFNFPWQKMPITMIRNLEIPGEFNGAGAFYHIISDMDEVNQLAGDWLATSALYGHPTLILENMSAPAGGVKLDVNQVMELVGQGRAHLLEYSKLDAQWDKIVSVAEQIRKKIPEFDLVEMDTGAAQISGFAIKLKLSSLIARVQNFQDSYEEGLAHALQYYANILFNNKKYVNYEIDVDLGGILPENIKEKIEIEQLKKMNMWATDEGSMRRLGVDQSEIDEIQEENDKAEEFEQAVMRANQRNAGEQFLNTTTGKVEKFDPETERLEK